METDFDGADFHGRDDFHGTDFHGFVAARSVAPFRGALVLTRPGRSR
ncbi:hypothetical protein [Streptomyces afghaniensis]|nr:hypothetical protein [Streptomyces afghaniensis]MDQ1016560.1 uncharacterized protein YjbI with pentapeptide repeats [Streptomyces afghaniensis]